MSKEAHEQLKLKRPVIIKVLHRDKYRTESAYQLARSTINHDDPQWLRDLITQAAQYVFKEKKVQNE